MRGRPSQTAEAVCLMRASDQRRPPAGRIVDDPYARWFLGPMSRATLASWEASGRWGRLAERLSPGLTAWVLTRHRYIDDCLVRALEGDVDQVVLLGAGYDTRAYRFARQLGGRPVFEVDFPATSRRKARIVARHAGELPRTTVRIVEIDFQSQSLRERLLASGFRENTRNFFIWEGVSMYLTREAVKATLRTVYELSAVGSEIAMDFWYLIDQPDMVSTAYRLSPNLLSFIGEPITFGIHPEDVGPFLERLGLHPLEVADAKALEERYVRDGRHVSPGVYLVHAGANRATTR
ncbi:MAG: SAM-dependent methyltransferase [Deltaproteobacteria bacterium]|nr:MAG: SAM-dependent methyltransferase [Deltaproteobacteria bacterium]TMB17483.1 MAG: SAM-dependent methyltransferase [Deltaproteobacteria bacterium]